MRRLAELARGGGVVAGDGNRSAGQRCGGGEHVAPRGNNGAKRAGRAAQSRNLRRQRGVDGGGEQNAAFERLGEKRVRPVGAAGRERADPARTSSAPPLAACG
jgi:hypothetical protein